MGWIEMSPFFYPYTLQTLNNYLFFCQLFHFEELIASQFIWVVWEAEWEKGEKKKKLTEWLVASWYAHLRLTKKFDSF